MARPREFVSWPVRERVKKGTGLPDVDWWLYANQPREPRIRFRIKEVARPPGLPTPHARACVRAVSVVHGTWCVSRAPPSCGPVESVYF
eukprot:2147977-Prymnesium_polylepis.1